MITPAEARRRASKEYAEQLHRTEEDIDVRMREYGGSVCVTIHLRDAVGLAFRYASVGWDVDVDHLVSQTELRFRPSETARGIVRRTSRADNTTTHEELTEDPKVYAAHGGWADEASAALCPPSDGIAALVDAAKQAVEKLNVVRGEA